MHSVGHFNFSMSPGFQLLLRASSAGPYSRMMANYPLPGTVASQLPSLPVGALGPR
jgi:hypothetical protein